MAEAVSPKRIKLSKVADETEANGLLETNGHAEDVKAASEEPKTVNELDKFEVVKVLNHLRDKHCIFLLAKHKTAGDDAVIKLEKTVFTEEISDLNRVCTSDCSTLSHFKNEIYSTLSSTPIIKELVKDLGSLKASLIYPATEKHISKYLSQEIFVVEETGDDYRSITLPYLEADRFSVQWIYNILEHKKEVERIIFEDPDEKNGFVLLPDMKWDGAQVTDLYCTAIIRRRDLKSIRDLRAEHLPLLRNILYKSAETIKIKYGVDRSQLVMYFHYQPSYYHLHVHVTHVAYEAPGRDASGAHLLQTVIDCIERDGSHFEKCTLPFKVKESSGLFNKFKEAGKI